MYWLCKDHCREVRCENILHSLTSGVTEEFFRHASSNLITLASNKLFTKKPCYLLTFFHSKLYNEKLSFFKFSLVKTPEVLCRVTNSSTSFGGAGAEDWRTEMRSFLVIMISRWFLAENIFPVFWNTDLIWDSE